MTDQPKKDPGGSKSQWGKSPCKWPLPCLLSFTTPEVIYPNGLLLVQCLNAVFSITILCICSNLAIITFHVTKFSGFPYVSPPTLLSLFVCFCFLQIWKVRKPLRPLPFFTLTVFYGQKKFLRHSKAFTTNPVCSSSQKIESCYYLKWVLVGDRGKSE